MTDTVTIRIEADTRERLKALARDVGVSQIKLIRALSFASRDDFRRLENRRLQAGD